jgi:hypothetical protein
MIEKILTKTPSCEGCYYDTGQSFHNCEHPKRFSNKSILAYNHNSVLGCENNGNHYIFKFSIKKILNNL